MQIEKFHWKTEDAFNRIKAGQPVVLLDCPLVVPHFQNWSMDTIVNLINEDFPCNVYISKDKYFPYWDLSKNKYGYEFQPPTQKISMKFREFLTTIRGQDEIPEEDRHYHYLHQSLVAEMGPKILDEYSKFSLQTVALYKLLAGWNEMTHNLLFCGKEGYTTPLHFDEQENIYTQLQGRKRVRLFAPEYWYGLYPYPNGHPHDRQCQIRLPKYPGSSTLESESERFRFPVFSQIGENEMYVDLEAGETLYIPQYWFHQMEGLTENISLSWWFKNNGKKEIDFNRIDLDKISWIAVRRNIENVMAHLIGFGKDAHKMFLSLSSGKIKIPGLIYKSAPSSSGLNSSRVVRSTDSKSSESNKELKKYLFLTSDLIIADTDAGTLTLHEIDEEKMGLVVKQTLAMLSTLIPAELVPEFLLQVVSGRFNSF